MMNPMSAEVMMNDGRAEANLLFYSITKTIFSIINWLKPTYKHHLYYV